MSTSKENIKHNSTLNIAEAERDLIRYLILGTQPLDIDSLERIRTIYSGSDMEYVADILKADRDFQYLYKQASVIKRSVRGATRLEVLDFLSTLIETGQIAFLDASFRLITDTIGDEVEETRSLL